MQIAARQPDLRAHRDVMQRGGVRMLHRVQHQVDGAAVLRADNKAYEDERVSADDLNQLMFAGGRVRMIFRRV